MSFVKKIAKVQHFVGTPSFDGPPIFSNSMPKAGTNLFEEFLIQLGYKRQLVRCLNEHNVGSVTVRSRRGRFYIGHLVDDNDIHAVNQTTFLLTRRLWDCLRSYINYMYIDRTHPVSRFIRSQPLEEAIYCLFFTNNNPNKQPLVSEYLRFYRLDWNRYDLVVPFSKLVTNDPELTSKLARILGVPDDIVKQALSKALQAESYTKNAGRIDILGSLSSEQAEALCSKVDAIEARAIVARLVI